MCPSSPAPWISLFICLTTICVSSLLESGVARTPRCLPKSAVSPGNACFPLKCYLFDGWPPLLPSPSLLHFVSDLLISLCSGSFSSFGWMTARYSGPGQGRCPSSHELPRHRATCRRSPPSYKLSFSFPGIHWKDLQLHQDYFSPICGDGSRPRRLLEKLTQPSTEHVEYSQRKHDQTESKYRKMCRYCIILLIKSPRLLRNVPWFDTPVTNRCCNGWYRHRTGIFQACFSAHTCHGCKCK